MQQKGALRPRKCFYPLSTTFKLLNFSMDPSFLRYARKDINQLCSDVECILQTFDVNTIDYNIFCNHFGQYIGKEFETELARVGLDCSKLLRELFPNLPLCYCLRRETGRFVIERIWIPKQYPGPSPMMRNYLVGPTVTPQPLLPIAVPQPFPSFSSMPAHLMQWMGPRPLSDQSQQSSQGFTTRPSLFATIAETIDMINSEVLKKTNVTIEELFESTERDIIANGQRLNPVIEKDFDGFVRRYITRGDIRAVEQCGSLIYKPQVIQIEESVTSRKYSTGNRVFTRDGGGEVTLPDSPPPSIKLSYSTVALQDAESGSFSEDPEDLNLQLKETSISSFHEEFNSASRDPTEGIQFNESPNLSTGRVDITPTSDLNLSSVSLDQEQPFLSIKSPLEIVPSNLLEKCEVKATTTKLMTKTKCPAGNFSNMPFENSSEEINNTCKEVQCTSFLNKNPIRSAHLEDEQKLIEAKRTCQEKWGKTVEELPDLLWILQLMHRIYGPVLIKEFEHKLNLLLDPECKGRYEFVWERYNINKARMYELQMMVPCPEDTRKTLPAYCIRNSQFFTLQVGIPSELFTYLERCPNRSDEIYQVIHNLKIAESDTPRWHEMNEMERFFWIVRSADDNSKVFQIREGIVSLRPDDAFFILTHIEWHNTGE